MLVFGNLLPKLFGFCERRCGQVECDFVVVCVGFEREKALVVQVCNLDVCRFVFGKLGDSRDDFVCREPFRVFVDDDLRECKVAQKAMQRDDFLGLLALVKLCLRQNLHLNICDKVKIVGDNQKIFLRGLVNLLAIIFELVVCALQHLCVEVAQIEFGKTICTDVLLAAVAKELHPNRARVCGEFPYLIIEQSRGDVEPVFEFAQKPLIRGVEHELEGLEIPLVEIVAQLLELLNLCLGACNLLLLLADVVAKLLDSLWRVWFRLFRVDLLLQKLDFSRRALLLAF